jgi:hypothetical protein
MSVQNPTIPTATQAKGIDASVNDLQTSLSFNLSWLSNGMGRAYRKNKTRSNGASQFLPMVYLGTNFSNDFFNATPDNDKEGQSIILVGDATHTDYQTGFYGWLEYPISIIFSANLNTIDSALLATEDFTEHLMQDVRDSLRGLLGKSYRLAITSETREFDDVYSEFDIGTGTTNKPFLPMTYFRFDCTMTVKEDCGNNVLNRCTAILQNLTSADLLDCILPTYDFTNTTTQAAVSAQQQVDMSNWLCGPTPPPSLQYSMSYDGINERLTVAANAAFTFSETSAFTYGVWAYSDGSQPTNSALFSTRTGFTGITGYFFNNFIRVLIRSSNGFQIDVRTDAAITHTEWAYWEAKNDGSGTAAGVSIWKNGVQVATTIFADNVNPVVLTGIPLVIGYDGASFDGNLGYLRIWNKVLSSVESLAEYNTGTMLTDATADANLVFENKAGTDALYGGTNWVFPDGSGTTSQDLPISVNMDYSNRTTNIPT